MTEIERIFIERDGMSKEGAYDRLCEMRAAVRDGEDIEDILYEESLELDYFLELLTPF